MDLTSPGANDPQEQQMPGTIERLAELVPDEGYALVEVDRGEPVGEAGHVLVTFTDEDDVVIPPDTDFESYVVYGPDGSSYTRDSWPEPASEPEPGGAEEKAEDGVDLPDYMTVGGGNY